MGEKGPPGFDENPTVRSRRIWLALLGLNVSAHLTLRDSGGSPWRALWGGAYEVGGGSHA